LDVGPVKCSHLSIRRTRNIAERPCSIAVRATAMVSASSGLP
jgi:hypothetical protein